MIRVDPYRTPIYTADEIDEMLSHIEPSGDTYTKSEIDSMVSAINDDIDTKQDILTAGTGISISEQNVISASGGSGGGEWTLRTPNDDWSDLFELDSSNNIVAKKNMLIKSKRYSEMFPYYYICKNSSMSNAFPLAVDYIAYYLGNNAYTLGIEVLRLKKEQITYSNIAQYIYYSDGVSATIGTSTNDNALSKSSLEIWIKD